MRKPTLIGSVSSKFCVPPSRYVPPNAKEFQAIAALLMVSVPPAQVGSVQPGGLPFNSTGTVMRSCSPGPKFVAGTKRKPNDVAPSAVVAASKAVHAAGPSPVTESCSPAGAAVSKRHGFVEAA